MREKMALGVAGRAGGGRARGKCERESAHLHGKKHGCGRTLFFPLLLFYPHTREAVTRRRSSAGSEQSLEGNQGSCSRISTSICPQ